MGDVVEDFCGEMADAEGVAESGVYCVREAYGARGGLSFAAEVLEFWCVEEFDNVVFYVYLSVDG